MATYQRVEYRIGKDGKILETVIDGSGSSCTLATEDLETALGEVESRELLPAYHDDDAISAANEVQSLNQY